MSRYKIYRIPRQNYLVRIQDLQVLTIKNKIQDLQDPTAKTKIRIQDLQDPMMKQKSRIQDPEDPRSSGSQDKKLERSMICRILQQNEMNAQGTRSTGPNNKIPRASSTGYDRKNDTIQDANFMKIVGI